MDIKKFLTVYMPVFLIVIAVLEVLFFELQIVNDLLTVRSYQFAIIVGSAGVGWFVVSNFCCSMWRLPYENRF